MRKIILFSLVSTIILVGCRSAQWHLDKAVEKGLEIEKEVITEIDSVLLAPVKDEKVANVDTAAILALCKDLNNTFDPSFAEPEKQKEKRKETTKKMQREICPQVDSLYHISIIVEDTVFQFPLRVIIEDGRYSLETWQFVVPYTKTTDKTTYIPPDIGYTFWTLIFVGIMCAMAGGVVAGFAFIKNQNNNTRFKG
jgi:hypothetical protein